MPRQSKAQQKKRQQKIAKAAVNRAMSAATQSQPARSGSRNENQILTKLSPCAQEYAETLAAPFNRPAKACIPWFPASLTRKHVVFAKGDISTSTVAGPSLGFGFIVLSPLRGCANDGNWCIGTTAASTATTIQTAGVGIVSFLSNSDYASAQFGPGVALNQPKLVAAGLRLMYSGEEFARGGTLVGLHEPTHNTLVGQNLAGLQGYKESERLPIVDEKWSNLLYRPVDNTDLNFFDQAFGAFGAGDNYMAFCFQAPNNAVGGVGQITFSFEAWAHYEIQGRNVRGKTPSHLDASGFSAVHAVSQLTDHLLKPNQTNSNTLANQFVASASSYLGTNTSIVQHTAPKPATSMSMGSSGSHESPWLALGSKLIPMAVSFIADML